MPLGDGFIVKLLSEERFRVDQKVRVKYQSNEGTRRTPNYARGKVGRVIKAHGIITGHEHDHADEWGPLYTILFDSKDVFGHSENEKILVDLHQSWLETVR